MKKLAAKILLVVFLLNLFTVSVSATSTTLIQDLSASVSASGSKKVVTVTGKTAAGLNRTVTVRILKPNGDIENFGQIDSDANGSFVFTYSRENMAAGEYTVAVNVGSVSTAPETTSFVYNEVGVTPATTPTPTPDTSSETGQNSIQQSSEVTPIILIVDGKVKVEILPKLDKSTGTATARIEEKTCKELIKAAKEDKAGVKDITIEVKPVEGAKRYVQLVPAELLTAGKADQMIEMVTPLGTAAVPNNMFNLNEVKDSKELGIAIGLADKAMIPKEVADAIGNRPVVQLEAIIAGKAAQWSNPEAPVTISIAYKPTPEELKNPEHIVVWYLERQGKAVPVPSGKYDAAAGKVRFSTTHFSDYAVAFVIKTFSDIEKYSWAKKQIEVLASRGIINGTSETTYVPQANIKRADAVLLLMKALGLSASFDSNFEDITQDKYYYEAVGVAKKLGIVNGVDAIHFNPEEVVTREDMMVIVHRAMNAARKKLAAVDAKELSKYEDSHRISSYAYDSIAALSKDGLVEGDGNRINPAGNLTRAEMAVLVYRVYSK